MTPWLLLWSEMSVDGRGAAYGSSSSGGGPRRSCCSYQTNQVSDFDLFKTKEASAYIIVHERDIEQLRDVRVLAEVVPVMPTTLVLQLRRRPNKLPDHVELGPVDLRVVIWLLVWVALMCASKVGRVNLT